MRRLFLLATLVWSAAAQTPHVYLDLSGPWTRTEPGRAPRPYSLPRPAVVQDGQFRLEKDIELPAVGLDGLAILMTPFGASYKVSVNGSAIGGLQSSHPLLAPPHRSVVLPIPAGLLHAGTNHLTVDVQPTKAFSLLSSRRPRTSNPLLGGTAELNAIAEGRQRAEELLYIYLPINVLAQLLFAAILLGLGRGSRFRAASRWMALYFAWIVVGNDLPFALEVFSGLSPTFLGWMSPFNRLVFTVTLTEASLALLAISPPAPLRFLYYLLLWLAAVSGVELTYRFFVTTGVDILFLTIAIRRQNRIATGFQWLVVGHNFISMAAFLPWPLFGPAFGLIAIGPLGFAVVPGYRVLIGVGLILLLIRQSVQDRNERERLAGELEAARTVQRLLLSGSVPGIEAVYLPAHEVGGDFYQVLPLDDGSKLVAIGDVSGKGLKAAMVVSMIAGILRLHRDLSPSALLATLNRALTGSVDGGFVTCLLARIAPGGSLTIANAGHLAPYSDGQEVVVESGLPLGIVADASWSECELPAQNLMLLSDGVPEAAKANGELFGFDRTAAISTRSAQEIAEAARAWGQNDDITVVTIQRIASSEARRSA